MNKRRFRHNPRRVAWFVGSILTVWILSIAHLALAQQQKTSPKKRTEVFTRPEPTRPIKPELPSVNRYQTDKVFLEDADSLYANEILNPGRQMLMGNVVFRQGAMWMYCDSAYYFPETNSLDAFGNVKMQQGDTLFVYSQTLFYDGNTRMAKLRRGPGRDVKLVNRRVTLTTDTLDYSVTQKLGWYNCGGVLTDELNTLTSVRGQYSTATKIADFSDDVVLINRKDGYRLESEHLVYNTRTHIASINTPTVIFGKNDTIITTEGEYNTVTDNAVLLARSTILHCDSAGNVTTLEGDSIIYDKAQRLSRAYMFRAPGKYGRPTVVTDTAHKAVLVGGYGQYDGKNRTAFATDKPLLVEYSRGDSIFLRADSINTYIYTKTPEMDSTLTEAKEYHVARAYHHARFWRNDIQGVGDSIHFNQADSIMHLVKKAVVWSGERQVAGNVIDVHVNDSTADWAELPDYGLIAEAVEDEFYNQLSGKRIFAQFENKQVKSLDVEGNVQTIVLPQENDSTINKLVNAESSFMHVDFDSGKMEKLKMWPEVQGQVIPIFLAKKNEYYLSGFKWYSDIRPQRDWFGYVDADSLPDEDMPEPLKQYFNNTTVVTAPRRRVEMNGK